jgi:hypothetical protein
MPSGSLRSLCKTLILHNPFACFSAAASQQAVFSAFTAILVGQASDYF